MSEKQLGFDKKTAEIFAIDALAFLAARPDALGRFLALTGIGPQTLRSAADDPAFLAGVLDYFLGNEALLTAFADDAGHAPQLIAAARRALGEA